MAKTPAPAKAARKPIGKAAKSTATAAPARSHTKKPATKAMGLNPGGGKSKSKGAT